MMARKVSSQCRVSFSFGQGLRIGQLHARGIHHALLLKIENTAIAPKVEQNSEPLLILRFIQRDQAIVQRKSPVSAIFANR